MFTKVITEGTRAVVISANDAAGPFSYRLYVNAARGLSTADATLVCGKAKTLAGAERAAAKKMAA